jgi:YHS domain-containing protein
LKPPRLFSACAALILAVCFISEVGYSQEAGYSQDDQDLVIRTYLYKADIQGSKLSKKDLAAFLDSPPLLSIRLGSGGTGGGDYEAMGKMIGSLYRVPNIVFLTSDSMRWEAARENLNATVRSGTDIFPFQMRRRGFSSDSVSLKIEAFRFEFAELSFTDTRSHIMREAGLHSGYQIFCDTEKIADAVGGTIWIDQELSVPIGASIIMALPTDDRSIFFALKVTRPGGNTMEIGWLGDRLHACIIGGTDPVCGKTVVKGSSGRDADELKASLVYKGEFYFFCSEECQAEFQADPDRYLKKAAFRRDPQAVLAADFPPRPKLAIAPEIAPPSLDAGQSMTGRAEFDLDESGYIAGVRAFRSDGLPLDQALREALGHWAFEPKMEKGKPVPSAYAANISISARGGARESENAAQFASDSGRPDILSKAEEYCRKLENAALYFVCRERIVETIYPNDELQMIRLKVGDRIKGHANVLMGGGGVPSGDRTIVYDYQLIRKDGRIREKRTMIEKSGANPAGGSVDPKIQRFHFERVVLGPVGLFGPDARSRFQYRVLKETSIDGKPAVIVEAKPEIGSAGGSVFGKAWLEKATGAVLRMETDVESFFGYDRIAAEYASLGFLPSVSFEIEFGFENGGLYYPSRVHLKESRYGVGLTELTVDYDRYKFFTVGTEVKYE